MAKASVYLDLVRRLSSSVGKCGKFPGVILFESEGSQSLVRFLVTVNHQMLMLIGQGWQRVRNELHGSVEGS